MFSDVFLPSPSLTRLFFFDCFSLSTNSVDNLFRIQEVIALLKALIEAEKPVLVTLFTFLDSTMTSLQKPMS